MTVDVVPGLELRMSHLAGAVARQVMASNPVILIPMGSHEDQGPHAPMGDFLLAERIALVAAGRAHAAGCPAYVAPVIPYGADDFFRKSVGGVVLETATFAAVLKDIIGSLIANGLTRIVLINGHGGNAAPILDVTRNLYRERDILIPNLYLWEAAYGLLPQIVGAEQTVLRAGHGADPLGSVGLHLTPEMYRPEHMPAPRPLNNDPVLGLDFIMLGKATVKGVPIGMPNDYTEIHNVGMASGDPSLCDAQTGQQLVDRLSDAIVALCGLLTDRS